MIRRGHRLGRRRGAAWALGLLLVGSELAAHAGDPNDAPSLSPPHGQPRTDAQRWDPPTLAGHGARRRVQISLVPTFASFFGMRFIGRPNAPVRGGGALLEADVHIIDPVWLRLVLSHTAHPVSDEFARDENDMPVQTAARGHVQATHAGVGIAYGLDLGRILPLADVGIGALWIRSPPGVQGGQLGSSCTDRNACDPGLVCAEGTCRLGTTPSVHAGIAIDVMVAEHWSLGAGFRYFALLLAPGSFPVYLTTGLRLGARF